jgi:hypothetical protein
MDRLIPDTCIIVFRSSRVGGEGGGVQKRLSAMRRRATARDCPFPWQKQARCGAGGVRHNGRHPLCQQRHWRRELHRHGSLLWHPVSARLLHMAVAQRSFCCGNDPATRHVPLSGTSGGLSGAESSRHALAHMLSRSRPTSLWLRSATGALAAAPRLLVELVVHRGRCSVAVVRAVSGM